MVRAKDDVIFGDESLPVHVFFLLLTSEDKRNFYLRAVTSIAQIIQEPSFKRRWRNAKTVPGLRYLILLGRASAYARWKISKFSLELLEEQSQELSILMQGESAALWLLPPNIFLSS